MSQLSFNEKLKLFLLNEKVNGFTLEDMWNKSETWKEFNHSYIQWLFPTTEPSKYHITAPYITNIEYFKENAKEFEDIKDNILTSLTVMMDFYGFNVREAVNMGRRNIFYTFDQNNKNTKKWLVKSSHHHLRISRILKCLMLFELQEYAEMFLGALLVSPYSTNVINEKTLQIWNDIVYKKGQQNGTTNN